MVDVSKVKRILKSKGISYAWAGALLGMSGLKFRYRLNRQLLGIEDANTLVRALGIENPGEVFFSAKKKGGVIRR